MPVHPSFPPGNRHFFLARTCHELALSTVINMLASLYDPPLKFARADSIVSASFRSGAEIPVFTVVDSSESKFVPWDVEVARINFGANCGPTSFAAVLGLEVCASLRHFPGFVKRRWCNFTQMKQALRSCNIPFTILRSKLPKNGLALVQWLGPWMSTDFGGRRSLKYTHWIGVERDHVFDHTRATWMPFPAWERQVAAAFVQDISGATGWTVKVGIEVTKSNNRFPSAANGLMSSCVTADNFSEYLAML